MHLPSGRVVVLEGTVASPLKRGAKAPLFSELTALLDAGEAAVTEAGHPLDVRALPLRDFHVLRAIATHRGWLSEDKVTIACRNCDRPVQVAPCAELALGPFEDGELDDPELDRVLDLSEAHPVPAIALSGERTATDVRLRDVTLGDAAALHRALRRRRVVLTGAVVKAMGVSALGPETEPRAIAQALSHCSDEAWAAVGDVFLQAHYGPRLAAVVLCPECGARNDVDAPYDREFEPAFPTPQSNEASDEVFPDFDAFSAYAQASYDAIGGPRAALVRLEIDEGVPACDDGGEPLLGSYVPPAGDPSAPIGSGVVTLYYRSFRAEAQQAWGGPWEGEAPDDEGPPGPYDWKAEVDETLRHELEHDAGFRAGSDPMDDDERAEIESERARLVGRKVVARQSVAALGADVRGFLARTWLIWAIVAAATLAVTVCDR